MEQKIIQIVIKKDKKNPGKFIGVHRYESGTKISKQQKETRK